MSITQRTIKLLLATTIAILVAQSFHLLYAPSAGIIALLSILDTRRSTLKIAQKRFVSMIIALFIGCVAYTLIGPSHFILPLVGYLGMYIPIAYFWKLESGIAPSTVLVLHLFLEKSISISLIFNEVSLFIIGAGIALIFNLYMPSQQNKIKEYHHQVENQLKVILMRFHSFLLDGDGTNEAKSIKELDSLLHQALDVVYMEHHNQLFNQTNYEVHYFEMRMEQNNILRHMAESMNQFHFESEESFILAQLFKRTADQLSRQNSAKSLLTDIDVFLASFRQKSLPKTREAFEARAILFHLLYDLKRFIRLKVDFSERYTK